MHVKVSNESGVAKVEVIRPADSEVVDTLEVGDGQTVTLTATVNDGQPSVDVGQVAGAEEVPAEGGASENTTDAAGGTPAEEAAPEGEPTGEAGTDAAEGSEPPEGAAA